MSRSVTRSCSGRSAGGQSIPLFNHRPCCFRKLNHLPLQCITSTAIAIDCDLPCARLPSPIAQPAHDGLGDRAAAFACSRLHQPLRQFHRPLRSVTQYALSASCSISISASSSNLGEEATNCHTRRRGRVRGFVSPPASTARAPLGPH